MTLMAVAHRPTVASHVSNLHERINSTHRGPNVTSGHLPPSTGHLPQKSPPVLLTCAAQANVKIVNPSNWNRTVSELVLPTLRVKIPLLVVTSKL